MYEISSNFDIQDVMHLLKSESNLLLGKFVHEENIPSEYLLKKVTAYLQEIIPNSNLRFALRREKQIEGMALIKKADWDSKHFDLNIGKLVLQLFSSKIGIESHRYLFQKVIEEASLQKLDLIILRISLDQFSTIQVLEKLGAITTDYLLQFYINPKNGIRPITSSFYGKVVEGNKKDEKALMKLSRKVFKINHFYADLNLPRDRCAELYAKWVSNCLKNLDCKIFVSKKDDGEITGFIACEMKEVENSYKYGIISLIAVKNEYAGKGIGSLLVTKALEWFSNYTNSVYVGTSAANIPAIKLYEKFGFKYIFAEVTLHLWISANKIYC